VSDHRSPRRDASPEGASRLCGVDLSVSVDDIWLQEWVAECIEALGRLLTAHAAFDAFLAARDNGGDVDDGR
jgi:hypothetical protein